jgi:hypothetical protein
MEFQLILGREEMISPSICDSILDHLLVMSLTFFNPNHLNLHFCQDEPDIIFDINSQS